MQYKIKLLVQVEIEVPVEASEQRAKEDWSEFLIRLSKKAAILAGKKIKQKGLLPVNVGTAALVSIQNAEGVNHFP